MDNSNHGHRDGTLTHVDDLESTMKAASNSTHPVLSNGKGQSLNRILPGVHNFQQRGRDAPPGRTTECTLRRHGTRRDSSSDAEQQHRDLEPHGDVQHIREVSLARMNHIHQVTDSSPLLRRGAGHVRSHTRCRTSRE